MSLAVRKPIMTSLVRYQSTIDRAAEAEYSKRKLEAHPETVSSDSSVRHVTNEFGAEDPEPDVDMMAGIKSDFVSSHLSLQLLDIMLMSFVSQKTIIDTFSLKDVPREALYVGMAGVLPYLATSLSTVYLAFDIQHAANTGSGWLLSGDTAETLLHIIEPIQLGYGASVN